MKEAWLRIGVGFAAFAVLASSSTLLFSWWAPLGALPFLAYTAFVIYWNMKRCVCSHRFISHDQYMHWCHKCIREGDAFVYNYTTKQVDTRFCKQFKTVTEAALEILHGHEVDDS